MDCYTVTSILSPSLNGPRKKMVTFSVRTHAHVSDTPSTQQTSVEHGKTSVCKTLLLTMYGEFRVPVDFIQANGFIQFHLC